MLSEDEQDREFFESLKKLKERDDKILKVDDSKIKPDYYKLNDCNEVWDIEEKLLADCEVFRNNPMVFKLWCSAFEYIFRCGMKGDAIKDVKKAITNLEKMVEIMERDNGQI